MPQTSEPASLNAFTAAKLLIPVEIKSSITMTFAPSGSTPSI